MKRKPQIKLILGSVIIAILPLLPTLLASFIASANGCELHEGFSNPCFILGYDFGNILYGMGIMAWFGLITIQLGALGVVIGLVWLLMSMYKNKRRTSN